MATTSHPSTTPMTRAVTPITTVDSRQQFVFFLAGKCPAKKNKKKAYRSGIITLPSDIKQLVDTLTFRAAEYWRSKPPLTDVEIDFVFHVRHKAADLDGAATTVLDCLKAAHVIVNDSMAHIRRECSEFVLIPTDQEEGVHIVISGRPARPPPARR